MAPRTPIAALSDAALRLPETAEGIACRGTALEKRTIKVRGKAFLFLGAADAMLKLSDSYAEAERLAKQDPARYAPGGHSWVKVAVPPDGSTPLPLLTRWVEESWRLFAPKALVAPPAKPPAAAHGRVHLLTYELRPTDQHPNRAKIGGAYVNCWVRASSLAAARRLARARLADTPYRIVGTKRETSVDLATATGLLRKYALEAETKGELIAFHTWPAARRRRG